MDWQTLLSMFQSGPQGSPPLPAAPGMPAGGPVPSPGLGIPSQAAPPASGDPSMLGNSGYEDAGNQFRNPAMPLMRGPQALTPRGGGPVGVDPMNFADKMRVMLGMQGINSFGDLAGRFMPAGVAGASPVASTGANPERPGGPGNPAQPAPAGVAPPQTQRPNPGPANTVAAAQGDTNVNINQGESFLQGVNGEPTGPGTVGATPPGTGPQGSQMSNIGAALAGVKAERPPERNVSTPSVGGGAAPKQAEDIILQALGLDSMKRPEPLGLSSMIGVRG